MLGGQRHHTWCKSETFLSIIGMLFQETPKLLLLHFWKWGRLSRRVTQEPPSLGKPQTGAGSCKWVFEASCTSSVWDRPPPPPSVPRASSQQL